MRQHNEWSWESDVAPPGRWMRGLSITDWIPGPLSPLFCTTFVPQADIVFHQLVGELGLPLPTPFLSVIGGRAYLSADWKWLTPRILLAYVRFAPWLLGAVGRWRREWLPELRETTARWERDPARMSDDELLDGIDELARAGARYWRAAYLPRAAGVFEQIFAGVYRAIVPKRKRAHMSELMGGVGGDGIASASRTAAHLDFVHATPSELGLRLSPPADAEHARDAAADAARRVARRLDPIRRAVFAGLLRFTRRWARLREEANLSMGHAWPVVRALVAERERRIGLPPGLGYFLTRDELADPPPDAASLAAERRTVWEQRWTEDAPLMLPAPFRFFGIDIRSFIPGGRATPPGELWGAGVGGGSAMGTACVLISLEQAERMQPGGVLVAPMTSPAWEPLMAQACAIVTDTGGPLSHASIVAREFGIPAVVGVGRGTTTIPHGRPVTVDGDKGTVQLHADGG